MALSGGPHRREGGRTPDRGDAVNRAAARRARGHRWQATQVRAEILEAKTSNLALALDAIKAREDKERLGLEAQAYANDILPKARGSAARQLEESRAYKARIVADAEGEAERFSKLLAAYERAPVVTRQRLYYETIEDVFARTNKVLVDTKGTGNMVYLPLDKLTERRVPPLTLDEQRQSSGTASAETPGTPDVSIEARRERGSR